MALCEAHTQMYYICTDRFYIKHVTIILDVKGWMKTNELQWWFFSGRHLWLTTKCSRMTSRQSAMPSLRCDWHIILQTTNAKLRTLISMSLYGCSGGCMSQIHIVSSTFQIEETYVYNIWRQSNQYQKHYGSRCDWKQITNNFKLNVLLPGATIKLTCLISM